MLRSISIQDIPPKYHGILAIRNENVRHDLATKVNTILKILKETEAFTPTPEVTILVTRFFGYLHKSCERRMTIDRRASWLLRFAMVVERKLEVFYASTRVQKIDDYSHVCHADMITMIVDIADKLTEYQQRLALRNNDLIAGVLEAIVEKSEQIKVGQPEHYYKLVNQTGDRLVSKLNRVLEHKKIPPGMELADDDLLRDLQDLLQKMHAYRTLRYQRSTTH